MSEELSDAWGAVNVHDPGSTSFGVATRIEDPDGQTQRSFGEAPVRIAPSHNKIVRPFAEQAPRPASGNFTLDDGSEAWVSSGTSEGVTRTASISRELEVSDDDVLSAIPEGFTVTSGATVELSPASHARAEETARRALSTLTPRSAATGTALTPTRAQLDGVEQEAPKAVSPPAAPTTIPTAPRFRRFTS